MMLNPDATTIEVKYHVDGELIRVAWEAQSDGSWKGYVSRSYLDDDWMPCSNLDPFCDELGWAVEQIARIPMRSPETYVVH